MAEVFANSEDPDQMPHSVVSDLGLYCLLNILLGVSRLQWVKGIQDRLTSTIPGFKAWQNFSTLAQIEAYNSTK